MSAANAAADEEESSSSSSPLPDVVPESPLHSMPGEFNSALDNFRDSWQRELKGQSGGGGETAPNEPQIGTVDVDILSPLPSDTEPTFISESDQLALAESLFRKAVELEQKGKVYDALPLYRKAVSIVPDIEFKLYEHQKIKLPAAAAGAEATHAKASGDIESNNHGILGQEEEQEAAELVGDLYEKFQMDLARDYGGRLLLSSRDAGVISTELHISDLPPEILLYILRWVVSEQLDLRSLEQCAAVCRGLYLCARDEDLWRLACLKIWGVNVGSLSHPAAASSEQLIESDLSTLPGYVSWRQMFIERERVLFNGCYISKTTYLRMGENSFQDQFYRPVQLVEYYRYLRFMPDGTVHMMMNADEPAQGVAKLRNLQQVRSNVLCGQYRLYGSTVTILLNKVQPTRITPTGHQYARQRRGSSAYIEEPNSTKYCIELRIMNTPKRKFGQLVWVHYSITQTRNKVETSSEFDLTPSKYPPLWFSPVRSYHLDAMHPLV